MKKILSIFAFVLLLTSLVACGDSPEEILAQAKDELQVVFAEGDSATSVTKDLVTLPSAIGDVVITWKSSNTTYLSNDGKVTRGENDVNVTLEATLTYDGETVKVPIALTIKAGSLADLVAAFEASYADTLGSDTFEATEDLTLVSTFQTATVTWSSNDTDVISNAGVVTRPSYTEGDLTIILTATLTQGLLDEEVEFLVFVPKLELSISEKLQQALAIVTAFPVVDGISANQEFLTTAKDSLDNEYTVVWTSSHPDILSAAGVVTQPEDADVLVTMTASITFGGVTETRTVEFNVFKKVDNTVYADTIADAVTAVADTFQWYAEEKKEVSTLPFVFKNLTIIGALSDSFFATDGTDLVMIYSSSIPVEVGKVYDIGAAIQNYYGIYELISFKNIALTATEVVGATPAVQTPQVVADINAYLAAKPAFDEDVKVVHEYVEVTARVYVQSTGVDTNYNTYLVSPDWADWNNDTVKLVDGTTFATPALMVYYKSNIDVLRALNGKIVTLNFIIQSFRTDKLVWYGNFIGDATDVEVVLTDTEAVASAKDAISTTFIPQYTETTTVSLPTELFGATIAWTSSDDLLINSTTGVITPVDGVLNTVTITAEIERGLITDTVTFTVKLGELESITVLAARALATNAQVRTEGLLLVGDNNRTYVLHDETGAIALYSSDSTILSTLAANAGKQVEIFGTRSVNGGNLQITLTEVNVLGDAVDTMLTVDLNDKDLTDLIAYQSYVGSATQFIVDSVYVSSSNNTTVTLKNVAGQSISVYHSSYAVVPAEEVTYLKSLTKGTVVNVVNAVIGWYNNPQFFYTGQAQVVTVDSATYTDAVKVYLDAQSLTLTPTAFTEAGTITLPATGTNGSVISWASDKTLINTETGAVTMPESGQETVVLTATISLNDVPQKTVTFNITVGVAEIIGTQVTLLGSSLSTAVGTTDNTPLTDGKVYNEIDYATGLGLDTSIFDVELAKNSSNPWAVNNGVLRGYYNTAGGGEIMISTTSGYVIASITINLKGANNAGDNSLLVNDVAYAFNIDNKTTGTAQITVTNINLALVSLQSNHANRMYIESVVINYDVAPQA